MRTTCCICDREMYLSMDEFLEVEQDIDEELFCDDCVNAFFEWMAEMKLREN
jgi:hypothetical protein